MPSLLLLVPLRFAETNPGLLGFLLPVHEPHNVGRAETGKRQGDRQPEPESCVNWKRSSVVDTCSLVALGSRKRGQTVQAEFRSDKGDRDADGQSEDIVTRSVDL